MIDEPNTQLSQAVEQGEWNKARHLAAIRVAQMMERSESPREVKALAISLQGLIDECENNDVTDAMQDTPIGRILTQARQMRKETQQ